MFMFNVSIFVKILTSPHTCIEVLFKHGLPILGLIFLCFGLDNILFWGFLSVKPGFSSIKAVSNPVNIGETLSLTCSASHPGM